MKWWKWTLLVLAVGGGGALFALLLPDIRRYLRMRRM